MQTRTLGIIRRDVTQHFIRSSKCRHRNQCCDIPTTVARIYGNWKNLNGKIDQQQQICSRGKIYGFLPRSHFAL